MEPNLQVKQSTLDVAVQGTLVPAPIANEGTVGYQTWEELEHIYQTSAEGLYSIISGITSLVEAGTTLDKEDTDKTIGFVVAAVSSDSNKFSKDLVKIHNQHKDKTGIVDDDGEYALYLGLFQAYVEINTVMRNVTLEPMMVISEFVENLVIKKNAELAAEKNAADNAAVVQGEVISQQ